MKIGIIGAGNIGSTLAAHFCRLEHTVVIANSRGPQTLAQVAQETGATPVTIAEVVKYVDLLILSIPMKGVRALPKDLLSDLPASAPIIDTGNYYPLRDAAIKEIDEGMVESEWTSHLLGRPVIKVFNNIVADSLLHKGLPKGAKCRIALPVSGDDVGSKQLVIALLDALGFDGVDAGGLSGSWRYQPGTPAYCSDPKSIELSALLAKADRQKAPKNRDQAVKLMAKLPPDFPAQDLVKIARLSAGLDVFKPKTWLALFRLGFATLGPTRTVN